MVIAMQRPEQLGVVEAVRPIVEEGIYKEEAGDLQDVGQGGQANRHAGSLSDLVVDPGARRRRQAERHQPAGDAQQLRLVGQDAADVHADAGIAVEQDAAQRRPGPADDQGLEIEDERQDHQQP